MADRLAALRQQLDRIDEDLLATIGRRIGCCVEIARVKRDTGTPMMQPHRIGLVQARAATYGARNGIDEGFLRRLYEIIIAETCRVEDAVIGDGSGKERTCELS